MTAPHSCAMHLPTATATQALGIALGQVLPRGAMLLLEGNLGSGKTCLVQGLGKGLGISDLIVSPTFALVQEYLEGRLPLYHFDLYRLSPAAVDALHIETYWDELETEPGLIAIEWPDRLQPWPSPHIQIRLTPWGTGRSAQIQAEDPDQWAAIQAAIAPFYAEAEASP